MLAYIEIAYDRVLRVLDYMGYLLMLTLSLLLWWGIYSGVNITVSQGRTLVQVSPEVQDTPAATPVSIPMRITPPAVAVEYDLDNAWSLASGL
ncbi:MAG: hypothetical protein AB8B64_18015 [Granulosicoccus sp.]